MNDDRLDGRHRPSVPPGTALIVEPRKHKALSLVVLNALRMLPSSWEVVIVHGKTNGDWVKNKIGEISSSTTRVRFHELPYANLTIRKYSHVMTSEFIWKIPKHENVLIFQTDSLIMNPTTINRGNRKEQLRDDRELHNRLKPYLRYTYVGAPWPCKRKLDRIGNGGLSLRKKSACLDAVRKCTLSRHPEDYFFVRYFNRNPRKYTVSPFSVANSFSVERIFHPSPWGIHKCWKYQSSGNWEHLCKSNPDLRRLRQQQQQQRVEEPPSATAPPIPNIQQQQQVDKKGASGGKQQRSADSAVIRKQQRQTQQPEKKKTGRRLRGGDLNQPRSHQPVLKPMRKKPPPSKKQTN